jgi:hypothetical protein
VRRPRPCFAGNHLRSMTAIGSLHLSMDLFVIASQSWRNGFSFAMRAILSRKRGIAIEDKCDDVVWE